MDAGRDCVVEGVEEPRGEGHLPLREDAEGVDLGLVREAVARPVLGGDDARDEGAVAEAVEQRVLVGPLGAVRDVVEVAVVDVDASVEDGHLDLLPREPLLPELLSVVLV